MKIKSKQNNNIINMRMIIVVIISIGILYITGYSIVISLTENNIKVSNGYLDLTKVNIEKPIFIKGEWEFYFNEHIDPYRFVNEDNIPEPNYEVLPGSWTSYNDSKGNKLKSKGKATYRLNVKVADGNQSLGIKLNNIWGNYRIFIKEGNKIDEIKVIGDEKLLSEVVKSKFFYVENNEFEIIIQLENENVFKSGILKSIYIGTEESILNLRDRYLFIDISGMVSLFLMFIYFMNRSYQGIEVKSALGLAGYSMFSLLFLAVTSEILISRIFPKLTMFNIYMLSMIFGVLAFYALLIYTDSNYNHNNKIHKKLIEIYKIMSLIYILIMVLTPILKVIDLGKIQAIAGIVVIVYVMYTMIKNLFNKVEREDFNILALLSINLLVFTTIYNTFQQKQINFLNPLYVLTFIISQAMILSDKYFKFVKTIEELSNKLKILDKMKDEFLERISYELKLPLKGIGNIARSLIDGVAGSLNLGQKENVEIISMTTKRLDILVDDILDYSHLRNGYRITDMKPINLESVLLFVLNIVSYAIKDKPIVIENNKRDDNSNNTLIVLGDENRLKQVFHNLIDTLLMHTNKGKINIKSRADESKAIIEIENRELYLDDKENILTIMDSVDSIDNRYNMKNGSYIGLWVAKEIIKIHKGSIKFSSKKDSGTVITMTLPIIPNLILKSNENKYKLEESLELKNNVKDNKNEIDSILVLEPNKINEKCMTNALNVEGYNVNSLDSQEELFNILDKGIKNDLYIINAYQSNSSGYDLVKEIRIKYNNIDMPILMIVDKTYVENISLALHLGANDVLVEPYDMDELKARVNTLIQLKKSISSLVISEMAFLKAQIKPHFIFNALSVISSLITRDPVKAKMLTLDFSDYLRSSFDFNSGEELLPLSNEIELIKAYVAIEKERFKDRLKVEFFIEEDLDIMIPSLIIQPIVENAIRHGVLYKIEGGNITINIYKENDELIIIVKDDGVGIEESKLANLIEGTGYRAGVGIVNINSRLIKKYGKGLSITSTVGLGTEVITKIPLSN